MRLVQFLNIPKKYSYMKKLIFSCLLFVLYIPLNSQVSKPDLLQKLEKVQAANPDAAPTATLKSASRLFADKGDLTSVIMVIPSGSTVSLIGWDSTFLKVVFEDNEGYIYSSHAVIKKPVSVSVQSAESKEQTVIQEPAAGQQQVSGRYTYLENRYGSRVAEKLYQGKIWKGMSAEMVKDSWGSPQKINRVINGNIIKEEWFYRNTWLYIQNSVLAEWGPVR